MNVLTVSITNSCNYSCYYCPVKKWLRPITGEQTPDDIANNRPKVNLLTNEALLKWLDAYIEPDKWIIEITGGEPGLYTEIGELVKSLDSRGFTGLVKTNGSLYIPKTKGIKLLSAWHKDKDFPAYYDEIIIIQNPDDNWKAKVKHCEDNGITYHTVLFDRQYEGKKIEQEYCRHNKIISTCHINSSGLITPCPRIAPMPEHTIFNMAAPLTKGVIHECPKCKNINDVEMFLGEGLRRKIESDLREILHNNTHKNTVKQA
jgi:MoaA/NifB/PqqE/SkfB family radical SAM enzyme